MCLNLIYRLLKKIKQQLSAIHLKTIRILVNAVINSAKHLDLDRG